VVYDELDPDEKKVHERGVKNKTITPSVKPFVLRASRVTSQGFHLELSQDIDWVCRAIEFALDRYLPRLDKVQGQLDLSRELSHFRLGGNLKVEMTPDCDRCLEPLNVHLKVSFNLLLVPQNPAAEVGKPGHNEETEAWEDDDAVVVINNDEIPLQHILSEQILLILPTSLTGELMSDGSCHHVPRILAAS
jgi:hypothetical protein